MVSPIIYALAVLLILAIVVWIGLKKKQENYQPAPVGFMTADETRQFLADDLDGYGRSLNQVNLEALGVFNTKDLLEKWSTSAMSWKPEEMQKLREAALIADYHINTHLKDVFKQQMSGLEWKFAKTMHPYLCDGLPHTRAKVIFLTDKTLALSDNRQLARLLIHEKTHIWERMYPEEMNAWMAKKGFRAVKPVTEDPLQRRNPDVDEWIYKDVNGQILGVKFTSTTPFNLSDCTYSLQVDHPYEQFASILEKMVK